MKYFAYGSNMSPERLKDRIHSAKLNGVYLLKGYILKFHMISKDGSSKCNAYYTGLDKDIIEGAVYEIDLNDVAKLDKFEGVGEAYEKKEVVVSDKQGHKIEAFLYIAMKIDDSLLPYTWYKFHVLHGAQKVGLSAAYISMIDKIIARKDPDKNREQRELKIYG